MANAPSDPSSGPTTSSGRPPRLPRWTRQEILVLIEGKRMVERRGRGRVGPGGGLAQPGPLEPKWAAVSAYCKRHGVNRGPVQCRKRWSNLAGDYKKIKEWERGGGAGAGGKNESFWGMRNDLRREKRLPGFFDREVYDILDGGGGVGRVDGSGGRIEMEDNDNDDDDDDGEEEEHKDKVDRDVREEKLGVEGDHHQARVSDHSTAGKKGGLFDGGGNEEEEVEERPRGGITDNQKVHDHVPVATLVTCAVPISEVRYVEPLHPGNSEPGTSREKQPSDVDREKDVPSQEGHKRRRTAEGEIRDEADHHTQLLQVLERNGRMVAAQLEAQNINLQLDRDQRREQTDSLLGVLNRLADSLSKISDKL